MMVELCRKPGIDFVHHIVIPETQNFGVLGFKECDSFFIINFLLQMLTSTQFDADSIFLVDV